MLTDLLSVTTTTQEGQKRKYIITADRDEHIRVSRYPQSWVIEGFCLGHTAFVSRLLVPGWAPQEVLSGGGDSWLGRWRWADGKCLQRIEVAGVLEGIVGRRVVGGKEGDGSSREGEEGREGGEKDKEEVVKPAVVGIWEVLESRIIIVAFERYTGFSLLPSFPLKNGVGTSTQISKNNFICFSSTTCTFCLSSPLPYKYPIPYHLRHPIHRAPILHHISDPLHMLTSPFPLTKKKTESQPSSSSLPPLHQTKP